MITGISVSGFRSLINFNVALRPGLNVIVGPNGSGKTNFVDLADFTAILVTEGLNLAMSHCGGSNTVFSKETLRARNKEITLEYAGVFDPKTQSKRRPVRLKQDWDSEHQFSAYRYEARIKYDSVNGRVYISSEKVELYLSNGDVKRVERKSSFSSNDQQTEVKFIPKNSRAWKEYNSLATRYAREALSLQEIFSTIDDDKGILIYLSRYSDQFEMIIDDICQLASANIDPKQAAFDNQVTNIAKLDRTGHGLASLLYQLQEGKQRAFRRATYTSPRRLDSRKTFEDICSWTREINSDVDRIEVTLSAEDILLKPVAYFRSNLQIPYSFSRLSDGTVKWVALTTMLLADTGYNIIEEPENFLHPLMQEKFVELARMSARQRTGRMVLLTTHSETLLNECKVDEIIVFYQENGQTRSTKPKNQSEIEHLIETTRFSLGYFYRVGAIDVG